MRSSDVTFRSAVIDESLPLDQQKTREIIEINYPGSTVAAFPATDIDPASGQRWCDLYGMKYQAFKDGDPDPDRVSELESKIAGHQAELDALNATKKGKKKEPVFQPKPAARAIDTPSNIGINPGAALLQGQQAASNPQYVTAGSPQGGPARPGDGSGPAFIPPPQGQFPTPEKAPA